MTSIVARDIAYITSLEIGKELQRVLNVDAFNINPYRQPLAKIRGRLDMVCRRYADCDACETLQEEYLQLFDALALLNEALGMKIVSRGLVQAALGVLNELKAKGGAR